MTPRDINLITDQIKPDRSCVIEIAGPPGTGKTTFAKLIGGLDQDVMLLNPPNISFKRNYPFFALNLIRTLPLVFPIYLNNQHVKPSRRELAWMMILTGWYRDLERAKKRNRGIILLDQAMIFMLSGLYGFGSEIFTFESMEKWWADMYAQWASVIDVVIKFDAQNAALLKRLCNRNKMYFRNNLNGESLNNNSFNSTELSPIQGPAIKPGQIRFESEARWKRYINRFRSAEDHVLEIMKSASPDLKIVQFDTTDKGPQEIVDVLLPIFNQLETGLEG